MLNTIFFIDNFDSFTYNLVDELKVLGNQVIVYRNDVEVSLIAKVLKEHLDKGENVVLMLSPGPSYPTDANYLIAII